MVGVILLFFPICHFLTFIYRLSGRLAELRGRGADADNVFGRLISVALRQQHWVRLRHALLDLLDMWQERRRRHHDLLTAKSSKTALSKLPLGGALAAEVVSSVILAMLRLRLLGVSEPVEMEELLTDMSTVHLVKDSGEVETAIAQYDS